MGIDCVSENLPSGICAYPQCLQDWSVASSIRHLRGSESRMATHLTCSILGRVNGGAVCSLVAPWRPVHAIYLETVTACTWIDKIYT